MLGGVFSACAPVASALKPGTTGLARGGEWLRGGSSGAVGTGGREGSIAPLPGAGPGDRAVALVTTNKTMATKSTVLRLYNSAQERTARRVSKRAAPAVNVHRAAAQSQSRWADLGSEPRHEAEA